MGCKPMPPTQSAGLRVCQAVAASYIRAARKSVGSLNVGPRSCMPIGSGLPSDVEPSVNPQGTLIPGMPAMLQVTVKMSDKYIASGSADFSPILNAGVGDV